MNRVKIGDKIILENGKEISVEKLIGQGGQGVVYEVLMDGKKYALKWYLPEYLKRIDQKKFYNNLCENVAAGSPSSKFLWPIAISKYEKNSFGYVMKLRPRNYVSFTSILNAKSKFKSLYAQLNAAKNISSAFQILHASGYSYQDINDGNFFIDVNNGDVLICDNDNVAPYGVWMGMAGKDRYMAPEVVLSKKRPGMESDLFSLAVIIYMLIFISHPLEGRLVHSCPCLTTKFMKRFYAEKPVFVYDPNDASNRPVSGIDNNIITRWPCYPKKLQDLFIQSFTNGLNDAGYRIRECEWIDCIDYITDSIVTCPICQGEQFYTSSIDGEERFECEDCHNKIRKPFILSVKNKTKVLAPKTVITGRHINNYNDSIVGEVIESTKHPGLWGIKNCTNETWCAKFSNGQEKQFESGNVIPLFKDTIIKFENKTIKIGM